jgi:aldehyde:ferredoxin oxidoreductase
MGSKDASRIIGKGSEKYVMHIKGQELAEELRRFKGWALGVSVSSRGGAHTMGAPLTERMDIDSDVSEKLFGVKTASMPDTYEEKAKLVLYFERFHALLDALGICFFTSNWMSPELLSLQDYLQLYNLATGKDLSESQFVEVGERIVTLGKVFNVKHTNFGPKDDYPPDRFFEEEATGTKTALDRIKWEKMLQEYYVYHGWDEETGIPKNEKLRQLDLNELIPICDTRQRADAT